MHQKFKCALKGAFCDRFLFEMNMVVFYHVQANSECQISSFGENQKQIESLEISSLPEKRGINTSHYKQVRSSPLPSQLLPREFLKRMRSRAQQKQWEV